MDLISQHGGRFLEKRFRLERALRILAPLFAVVAVALLICGLAFVLIPAMRLPVLLVTGLPLVVWFAALIFLLFLWLRRPEPARLARRADQMLSLPDHLTSLHEFVQPGPWRDAVERDAAGRLRGSSLAVAWPVRITSGAWSTGAAAVLLTLLVVWIGGTKSARGSQELAALEQERRQRVEDARPVFDDWEKFAELTEDPELKKLFAEAADLREAMAGDDAAEAMLEMNRIEEKISQLAESTSSQGLGEEAGALAEALEAFEGMSAMASALRREDFEKAATEAEKLAAEAAQQPNRTVSVRRDAAVAEMLAEASESAAKRGQRQLSESLEQLSQAAREANGGKVPKNALQKPATGLCNSFKKEGTLKNRGRMLAMGRQQIEALRQQMRGSGMMGSPLPMLAGEGGEEAGEGAGAPPLNSATALIDPTVEEALSGTAGEGESEVTVTSANTGTAAAVSAGRETAFEQYAELSRQAVADETIPMAHRRTIRDYFERIRPASTNP